jgi:glyoxylase-like metal-dependent hydrolase (beta-lactamase superfamily II)
MTNSRRQFVKTAGLLTGGALLPWQKLLASSMSLDASEMYLVRDKVGVYTNRGGTIAWLVDKEGLAVVDTQFPEQSEDLIQKLREKTDRRVDVLFNTHHHGDHSSGNIAFKDIVDKVVAHENSKANQKRVAIEREREATQLYPDTTFTDKWSQKVGSETITTTYFGPAHTNGDTVIHFENANVAHMGDLLFNRRFPFIDRSSGADIENWIKVLRKIRKHYDKDTLFIFGHARESLKITGTYKDLKAKEKFLKKLLKYTKKQIKKGQSLEEMSKIEIIPGAPEWQGRGIERCLKAAYEELTSTAS